MAPAASACSSSDRFLPVPTTARRHPATLAGKRNRAANQPDADNGKRLDPH